MIIIIIVITIIKLVTTTFNPTSMFVNQKVQTLRCTSSVPLVYSVVGSVEGQRTRKQHGKQRGRRRPQYKYTNTVSEINGREITTYDQSRQLARRFVGDFGFLVGVTAPPAAAAPPLMPMAMSAADAFTLPSICALEAVPRFLERPKKIPRYKS